ncbi:hypothetical protein ACFQUU_16745 [Herbaspirillum sp. GCM10030257]|uniref:hypothetical protein n=1 Tax=Herbaspirillum sp. GCM10030257 TaxID=3273393 RepID=UPI00362156AC
MAIQICESEIDKQHHLFEFEDDDYSWRSVQPKRWPDPISHDTVKDFGDRVVNWWKRVGQTLSVRDMLFSDLLDAQPEKTSPLNRQTAQLDYAKSLGFELPLKLDGGRKVAIAHWTGPAADRSNNDHERGIPSADIKALYKSFRRHIFKRYVRSHKHCNLRLTRRSQAGVSNILSDDVCPVCLAYFAWRMSAECTGMNGWGQLDQSKVPVRLMSARDSRLWTSRHRLHWTFYSFFGIWQSVLLLCEQNQTFQIGRSWRYAPDEFTLGSCVADADALSPVINVSALYPHPGFLSSANAIRCLNSRFLPITSTGKHSPGDFTAISSWQAQTVRHEMLVVGDESHLPSQPKLLIL